MAVAALLSACSSAPLPPDWQLQARPALESAVSAQLLGDKRPMMRALARLGGLDPGELPKSVAAMGISSKPSGLMALFSTHPPIEDRIRALQSAP